MYNSLYWIVNKIDKNLLKVVDCKTIGISKTKLVHNTLNNFYVLLLNNYISIHGFPENNKLLRYIILYFRALNFY